MKTTTARSMIGIVAAFAAMGLMVSASLTGSAFAHAHMTITPDIENVNPIAVTIGHTDEPTFGVKPGVHDGMHALTVILEDERTALPLEGAQLFADKYYFKDIRSFERATSLDRADQIERNITVGSVFGEPGHYMARQIMQPGIYGYHVYGAIDYFGIAKVPIDTTIFCRADDADTSKFTSEGWHGGFGCTDDINDLYFPDRPNLTRNTANGGSEDAQVQQVALTGGSAPSAAINAATASSGGMAFLPALQILAVAATASVGGFFGLRVFRSRNRDRAL